MTHNEIRDLLGAYALYALSPEERSEVEAHVQSCDSCRAEVRELEQIHGQLGLLAEEMAPPPALRIRLMNIVELEKRQWQDEQARSAITQGAPSRNRGEGSSGRETERTAWTQGGSAWERLRAWLRGTPKLITGSALVAVVAVVAIALILVNRNTVTVVRTYACAALLPTVNGSKLADTGCSVKIRSDHTIELAFNSLPALDASKAYELWALPMKGNPVPIAGFTTSTAGAFSRTYKVDDTKYAKAAISIEQAPGNSILPRGPVIFVLPLKS